MACTSSMQHPTRLLAALLFLLLVDGGLLRAQSPLPVNPLEQQTPVVRIRLCSTASIVP